MNWHTVLRGVIVIIAVIVAIFYYHYDPSSFEFVPKCQILSTTGYLCPGCGMQRAVYSLLHFNILDAFRANGFFVSLVLYFVVGWLLEKMKPCCKIDKIRNFIYNNIAYWVIAVAMVLFTVFRNLSCFT